MSILIYENYEQNLLINSKYLSISEKRCIFALPKSTGCSVVRLARLFWEQEVESSNPSTPTLKSLAIIDSEGFFLLLFCIFQLYDCGHPCRPNGRRFIE